MNTEYNILLYILQIVSIYNAIVMGWDVKKIGMNTYELTKKNIRDKNIDLNEFVNSLISSDNITY
ncbi:hypothetical protein QKU48_gp0446 [Fadolivirus algeromassiliense]|jgi:hypothetical protein|uniref:Uncharacterized protein n=1 Tax=Fadolivirus FV1/VV64 TaxID=3070911 RepID=A0A7D3QV17_9VIRU|nr:hypothetical protein QKU48_gp0446 [Fadolivirus algeromassiliense]QKF93904.1 hypothetical protein Fadolivirus_1_446 [Fadolivirus FV1/VV64]